MMFTSAKRSAEAEASRPILLEETSGAGAVSGVITGADTIGDVAGASTGGVVFFGAGAGAVGSVVRSRSGSMISGRAISGTTASVDEATRAPIGDVRSTVTVLGRERIKIPARSAAMIPR
jgi:hypothetical protein